MGFMFGIQRGGFVSIILKTRKVTASKNPKFKRSMILGNGGGEQTAPITPQSGLSSKKKSELKTDLSLLFRIMDRQSYCRFFLKKYILKNRNYIAILINTLVVKDALISKHLGPNHVPVVLGDIHLVYQLD